MKKNLLYTALWLMGLMGTLAIWVVNANSETINITWTNWTIIQTNYQKWDDLELYFLSWDWTTSHFTIMDRNLWATGVYNQNYDSPNAASYWYYYQWWNNYGFPNQWKVTGSSTQVDASAYGPGNYYSSGSFIKNSWRWDTTDNANLWWWESGDVSDKQWPCPTWYHVPSTTEWKWIYDNWDRANTVTSNKRTQWASDLLIPFAGYRYNSSAGVNFQGSYGYYWSSSRYNADNAYYLRFSSSALLPLNDYRALGFSVRCFKNSPSSTFTFTLNSNGWNKAVVAFTGTVWSGKFTTLWTPTRTNSTFDGWYDAQEWWNKLWVWSGVVANIYARWTCPEWRIDNGSACVPPKNTVTFDYSTNWWSATTSWSVEVISGNTLNLSLYTWTKAGWGFEWWSETSWTTWVLTSNPVITTDKTLYAVFSKDLEVTYLSWVWVASIWVDASNCKIYNKETSCTVKTPTITLKDGYWTGIWSTWGNVVNPWSDITLTADDTYTASATPNTYTVSYDANGGIWSIASSWYTYDLSWNLAENTFTKTWYVFSGWKYNDEIYTWNQEIKNLTGINGAIITMVTQWTPIKYSVEFTWTDVSWTMLNQEFTYDISQDLTANAFTKTGYIFSGWTYWTTGYADKQNVSNLTTTDGATVTLTAQWTPITYTISFSWNAADATWTAPDTINAEYDSGDIAPDNTFTLTGYTFTWWNTESDGSGTWYATWAELKNLTTTSGKDVKLYAQWEVNIHKLSFVVDWNSIQSGDIAYWITISAPANPTKDSCNSFAWWTSSVEWLTTTGTMPDSDVIFTANWNYTCSRSSGWWGSSRSSSVISNDSEKSTDSETWNKVDSSADKSASEWQDNTQDSSANASEWQYNSQTSSTYSQEFQEAYEFAKEKWITTMPTINEANMNWKLTRIAMAKMLSYYAINVLWQKPDETRNNKFNDITDKLDSQYDSGVTLAYQLWIMWINMPDNNFRPNDEVTRAEFATALSRMLYGTPDWNPYYSTHLAKLKAEWILKNDDYKMKELRWYVMIMLKRSAK